MPKKEDPAPTVPPVATPPGSASEPPAAPRKLALQFGPTPSPPGSRLKQSRK